MENWTYGAEHELGDWDTKKGLPEGFLRANDWTLVNSNTIAVQPNPKDYPLGGEINTPPTETIQEQLDCLNTFLKLHPDTVVNHRSNLHIHIRVPGLKNNLKSLKKIQVTIHGDFRELVKRLEPIPKGLTEAERKREKRRRVSHQTFLTSQRLKKQLSAETVEDFFRLEVPQTKKTGEPMWHAQPRVCVNLRQLLQTDTIEFRHFPGTLDLRELESCFKWCRDFLICSLRGYSILSLFGNNEWRIPRFPKFIEGVEIGYQATASHNGLKKYEIQKNIELIEKGEFSGSEEEEAATKRARGLSR